MAILQYLLASVALVVPVVDGYKGFKTSLTLGDFKEQVSGPNFMHV